MMASHLSFTFLVYCVLRHWLHNNHAKAALTSYWPELLACCHHLNISAVFSYLKCVGKLITHGRGNIRRKRIGCIRCGIIMNTLSHMVTWSCFAKLYPREVSNLICLYKWDQIYRAPDEIWIHIFAYVARICLLVHMLKRSGTQRHIVETFWDTEWNIQN